MATHPSFSPTVRDETPPPQSKCIGYGSYGVVYRSEEETQSVFKSSSRWVVSENGDEKRLVKDPESVAIREAIILSTLRHPHMIPVTQVELTRKRIHLYMPYRGVALNDWVDATPLEKRYEWFWHVMYQIVEGAWYLVENGVQHVDLRPENVLVMPDERGLPYITLIDLGLCSVRTGKGAWSDGIGCWICCPPEVLINDRYVHSHTSLWSIALLGAYIILGYNPTYRHMKKKKDAADAASTLRFLRKWIAPLTHVPLTEKETAAMEPLGGAWVQMFRRMTQWFPSDRPTWAQVRTYVGGRPIPLPSQISATHYDGRRVEYSWSSIQQHALKADAITWADRCETVAWMHDHLHSKMPFSLGTAVYILDGFLLRALAADCMIVPSDLKLAALACVIISSYLVDIHSEGMVAKCKTLSGLMCSMDAVLRWMWDVCRVWDWKCWTMCPMLHAPFDSQEDNEKELLRRLLNVKEPYTAMSIWTLPCFSYGSSGQAALAKGDD